MIVSLAVLAVIAQVFVVGSLVAWLVQRVGRVRSFDALVGLVGADSLRLASLVSVVATIGSLYFSEVRHFTPCVLCWYQRIGMYPLAVMLPIAAFRNDRAVGRYALPLSVIGGAVSIYHYQLERFPDQESISCSSEVPCTTIWFEQFGYITLPMLALSAFALIATLIWIGGRHGQGFPNET